MGGRTRDPGISAHIGALALSAVMAASAVAAPPVPTAPWPSQPSVPSPLEGVPPSDVVLPPVGPEGELPAAMVGPLRDRLRERLDAHREAAGAPGACLAVILPGGRELDVVSGLSHRGDPDYPMTSGDRMPVGSASKAYAAAVAMLMVEQGVLDLDATIGTYVGDRAWLARLPGGARITTRMLLNHTSGLPERVAHPAFISALRGDPWRDWSPEDLLACVLDAPGAAEPGAGWSYADTNFVVLGLVLEAISGQGYNDLLRERVLTPLGLVWTDPIEQPELWGLIPGYTARDNPYGFPEQTATDERYCVNPTFGYAGCGLITTTPDLARWADHLYGGRVLRAESLAAMTLGVPCTLGDDATYGLGTTIWATPHGPAWGHSGWFPGYMSMVCHYPELGVTIAYQQNTDVRGGVAAMRRLMDGAAGLVKSTLERVPPSLRPPPEPGAEPGVEPTVEPTVEPG